MLARKIIFCLLAVLCLAAATSVQEDQLVNSEEGFNTSGNPAFPRIIPLFDENNLPATDPTYPTHPHTPHPEFPSNEEKDYSFEDIMAEIDNQEEKKNNHSRKEHKGDKSWKKAGKNSKNSNKKQKDSHHHDDSTATASSDDQSPEPLSTSYPNHSPRSSSNYGQIHKFKKFSKGGRIVFGVIFLIVASATLLCCVRSCKKRRQARRERKIALAAELAASNNDTLQQTESGLSLGTPIQVPPTMTMLYAADGNISATQNPQGPIGYYVMPQQFSHPALANNHQVMKIEMPTILASVPSNPDVEAQVVHQISAPRYPMLNNVVQGHPQMVYNYPQVPQAHQYNR